MNNRISLIFQGKYHWHIMKHRILLIDIWLGYQKLGRNLTEISMLFYEISVKQQNIDDISLYHRDLGEVSLKFW